MMKMGLIEIPEFPVLRGEKAIKALNDFIGELEGQRGKELTKKQKTALIKLVKELISYAEAESRVGASEKGIKKMRFVTHFKKAIVECVHGSANKL